jgi:hypothetical protein
LNVLSRLFRDGKEERRLEEMREVSKRWQKVRKLGKIIQQGESNTFAAPKR